ncbi:hypothetical protein ACFSTC_21055 [Nonomuraea ferruginea]
MARLFAQQGHHREALPHDEQAFDLFRTLKNRRGQAAGLNAIGWHHAHLGHHHRALAHCSAGPVALPGDRRSSGRGGDLGQPRLHPAPPRPSPPGRHLLRAGAGAVPRARRQVLRRPGAELAR